MRIVSIAAIACALAGTGVAQAQNLLTNGSFETGIFSGWTQFGDTSATGVVTGTYDCCSPTDGEWQAVFGPVFGFGGISQAVGSAGNSYTISFDLGNDNGYGASVSFGGVTLLSNPGNSGYVHYSFTTTALDNSGLSFSFFNPPAYYNLDNVVVEANGAVPEPASWALMLGGFGLVGGAMRSRRKAAVSFA